MFPNYSLHFQEELGYGYNVLLEVSLCTRNLVSAFSAREKKSNFPARQFCSIVDMDS